MRALVDGGVPSAMIERVTGRSWPTVHFVIKSTSFENYKKISSTKKRKTKSVPAPEMPESEPHKTQPTGSPLLQEIMQVNERMSKLIQKIHEVNTMVIQMNHRDLLK